MLPNNCVTLFVILFATTRLTAIRIKTTEADNSAGLVEATVNILTSCYANRGHAIVIVGDLPDLIKTLWSRQLIPVVLFSPRQTTKLVPVEKNQLHKLHDFVIVASSDVEVTSNMATIANSIWWNHMGSFLVVVWPPNSRKTCRDVPQILAATWELNALYTKVICQHRIGRIIHVHNPYTNEAPNPWLFMGTWSYKRNHPFSIFYRGYKKGESMCDNLDFDKTKNLSGYPIIYLVLTDELGIEKGNIYELQYIYHFNLIINALNATTTILKRLVDYSEHTNSYHDLDHGKADICLNPTEQYADATSIYPFVRTRLYIMTQYPGHKTQLQKILDVVDVNSRISVCLVLFVTMLFFKCVARQPLVSSILNVLRAICNTGFTNIPQNTASRLFLTTVLMFIVTMQGIYQGQLASLLTTNVSLPVVNSLKDLANSDHTVYGFSTYAGLFDDPKFVRRYVSLHDPNCTKHVIRDSLAACINIESELIKPAKELKFHISTEHIATLEISWLIRESWPLKEKFDKAGMSMFEADITGPFESRLRKVTAADFAVDDDVKSNQENRVMTFKDLRFAFVILGIGLTFASITFIVEIAIDRYRSRSTTVAVQFLTSTS